MKRLANAAALAAVVLLAATAVAAQQHPPYTYRGTVHAVQPRAGALDLITGVGLALRLVHIRTLSTTVMARGGTSLTLSQLKPGDVVEAACRLTDAGLVADRIEQRVTP